MDRLNQRQLQAQERRTEILAAAKKLFAKNGYHATTTRSINTEVGMADGLLYHYFPKGKIQILETLVQEELDRKRKSVKEALQEINTSMHLEDLLTQVGRVILEAATRDREMMVIVWREHHLIKNSFNDPVHELSGFYRFVADLLQKYMEKGEIRSLDPLFVAIQFISPFSVYTITKALMDESDVDYFGMDEKTFLRHNVKCTLQSLKKE